MAEWSKALVLGTSLFGGVGSNPTSVRGGLAQSVECVVRNDEAWGSKPQFSIFSIHQQGFLFQKNMVPVGFEPTPPKRLELESSALDRSATKPSREKHYFNKIIGVFDKNLKKNGQYGDRTHDPWLIRPMLYHLS